DFIKGQDISKTEAKDYLAILLQSKLDENLIELAIQNGMKLQQGKRSLTQFREYIEYLEGMPKHRIKRGLKGINEIYDFNFRMYGVLDNITLSPSKRFLIQRARLQEFEDRRFMELLNDMKLKERHEVV